MDWKSIPIPDRMKHLPIDRRGYPIPASVQIDPDGTPHFALNPEDIRQRLFQRDQCSICGGRLLRGRWLVGGPGSAFHQDGAFRDPPVHAECGRYALQVCPYLAMPSYSKQVSARSLDRRDIYSYNVVTDPTVIRNRPDPFIMIMFVGQKLNYEHSGRVRSIVPNRPYRQCEFWSQGRQLSEQEGKRLVAEYFSSNESLFADPSKWETPESKVIETRPKRGT